MDKEYSTIINRDEKEPGPTRSPIRLADRAGQKAQLKWAQARLGTENSIQNDFTCPNGHLIAQAGISYCHVIQYFHPTTDDS